MNASRLALLSSLALLLAPSAAALPAGLPDDLDDVVADPGVLRPLTGCVDFATVQPFPASLSGGVCYHVDPSVSPVPVDLVSCGTSTPLPSGTSASAAASCCAYAGGGYALACESQAVAAAV